MKHLLAAILCLSSVPAFADDYRCTSAMNGGNQALKETRHSFKTGDYAHDRAMEIFKDESHHYEACKMLAASQADYHYGVTHAGFAKKDFAEAAFLCTGATAQDARDKEVESKGLESRAGARESDVRGEYNTRCHS